MAEKRKPSYTFLLKKESKTYTKIELFPASLWGGPHSKFRIRKDGVWYPKGMGKLFFYKTEFINIMMRNVTPY